MTTQMKGGTPVVLLRLYMLVEENDLPAASFERYAT